MTIRGSSTEWKGGPRFMQSCSIPRLRSSLTGAVLAVLVSVYAVSAAAELEYHNALLAAAGTECPAKMCILCHQDPLGGDAPSKPFFPALVANGYAFTDSSTIGPALKAMREKMVDTDLDGVLDVDELRQATDPNTPDGMSYCYDLRYGCGARVARPTQRSDDDWTWISAIVASLGLLAFARRRRL